MKQLTQAELQNIEHATKILNAHEETVERVVNKTEDLLNTYGPIMRTYVDGISEIQQIFTGVVVNIIRSSDELKIITNNTQRIHDFVSAVIKLDAILTPSLVEKLSKLVSKE